MEYKVILSENGVIKERIPVNDAELLFRTLSKGDGIFLGSVGHRLTVIEKHYSFGWADSGEYAELYVEK